jgi:hypothetical protein
MYPDTPVPVELWEEKGAGQNAESSFSISASERFDEAALV